MKEAALILFGAVIGFFVSRFQSALDKRRDAKNEFRVFVSLTKGRIPKEGFVTFHAATKKEIRDATSRLIPSLRACAVQTVESACAAYVDIDEQTLDDEHEEDLRREALASDKLPVPPKPSDILKTRLDRLYESIT